MKFSTLFQIGKNLNLDRKTLINLRWIAHIRSIFGNNFGIFFIKLEFPILSYLIILIGVITNLLFTISN